MRTLEQSGKASLTADDLATGKTVPLVNYEADPVELNLLHMITGDPKRTPTVTLFGNTDFWLSSRLGLVRHVVRERAGRAGRVEPRRRRVRRSTPPSSGCVGPGVRHLGVDGVAYGPTTPTSSRR